MHTLIMATFLINDVQNCIINSIINHPKDVYFSFLDTCNRIILSLCVDFAAQAADIFVFSSDVSVSGRVSFAISSPDSAGVIKENVKRQTSYVSF